MYQGRIAVYLAVRKINELREAGNESEIKKYALEMEKCEDIAVVYMDGNNKKYHSIHQVKNEKGCKLTSYKDPLIQLMLEKGFCRKNNYGAPYSDRDELDSKIKEETELLSDISDDSVIIIQDIRNQIYNNYLKKVEKTIQEILADVVTEEMYQSLQDAKKYGSQILEVERILEKIGVGLNRKDNESIVEGYNNLLTKVKEALKYIPTSSFPSVFSELQI